MVLKTTQSIASRERNRAWYLSISKLHVQVSKSKHCINYITIGTVFLVLCPITPSLAMVLSACYTNARSNAVALYLICQDQQH